MRSSGCLEQRWSFAEKNDFKAADLFADVSLFQSAGLALGQGEAKQLRLSLRPECHRVLEFLDREAIGKSRLAVQGYPGTGKSCLVWLWACKQALAGKHVRWYHIMSALGDGVAAAALHAGGEEEHRVVRAPQARSRAAAEERHRHRRF